MDDSKLCKVTEARNKRTAKARSKNFMPEGWEHDWGECNEMDRTELPVSLAWSSYLYWTPNEIKSRAVSHIDKFTRI